MMKTLPNRWRETTLKDVVSILGDGLHGTPQYTDDGEYYFVNGNNLVDGKIIIKNDTKRTSEEEYNKYKKDLNNRTLLVSINGTLGNIAEYNGEKCFLGKSACYFNIIDGVSKEFIKYIIFNNHFQKYIHRLASGTTIKNVSLKTMREYPFYIPKIDEQKAIANVLSSFDKKIELLKEQNQTLETMAQTVFLDFFNTSTNLIEVTLGKLVNIKYGKDHKHLKNGCFPLYGSGGIMRYVEKPLYDKESILIPRKGTLGNLFFVQKPFWSVDTIFYTEIDDTKVFPIYLYYQLKRFNFANLNVGSAVPSLTTNVLNAVKLEIPNLDSQKKIVYILKSLNSKILNNLSQIETLSETRDSLLPKLMSGKVRVKGFDDE